MFNRCLAGVVVALCLGAAVAHGAILTVVNTNDTGSGSLREAITVANANAGADEIRFNIPGPSLVIQPLSELPVLTGQTTIDGTTQPGYIGTPLIEIDGRRALAYGIGVGGIGNTIRGLRIYGYLLSEISISGTAHAVERCHVSDIRTGRDSGSLSSLINLVFADGNKIGGPGVGNVISGGQRGISLRSSNSNTIQGNLIGTDAAGTVKIGNTIGISVENSSTGNLIGGTVVGARNIISGNGFGVFIDSGETTIQGNYIGTNTAGTSAIANDTSGIQIQGCDKVTIGGSAAGAGNVISGNLIGIQIFLGNQITVKGNKIGANPAGTAAVGNNWGMIVYGFSFAQTSQITIGGAEPGAGNLISGNGDAAITIGGATASNITLQGNKIGTDITGTLNLFNDDQGILIANGAHDILIGGSTPEAANIIAFNRSYGITMRIESGLPQEGFPRRIRINGNSIHSHGTYNLDIERDSLDKRRTPNDHLDPDDGPNGRQNYPVLNTPTYVGTSMRVTGTLDSIPGKTYRIEFFTSPNLGTDSQAEARTYAGFVSATTNAAGAANFAISIPRAKFGRFVTATATDPDGNTSELSVPVTAPTAAEAAWILYR